MTDYHNTLVKSISHAAYIMPDVRFRAKGYSGIDSDKRIKRCLSCPYDECIDCYDNPEAVYKQIRLMGEQGKTIAQISNKIGISKRSVHYLISRYSSASSNMNNKGDRRIMRVNNSITPQNTLRQRTVAQPAQTKQEGFTAAILSATMQNQIMKSVPDERARARFTSAIIEMVSNNNQLQKCTPASVVAAALRGEGQGLILGHGYYVVPYGAKAAYITSYRGYITLAMSTGLYEDIDCFEVREGEYKGRNMLTGKPEVDFSIYTNDDERESKPIIGYYAYFRLKDGYFRSEYWSMDKLLAHAEKYSPAFDPSLYQKIVSGKATEDEKRKADAGSPWYSSMGRMCTKTVLRSLLNSGFAPLSNEVRSFIGSDYDMVIPSEAQQQVGHANVLSAASDPLIIDAKPVEEVPEKTETPSGVREAPLTQDKSEGKETPTEPQKVSERPRKMPRAVSRAEPKQETSAETAQTSVFEQ